MVSRHVPSSAPSALKTELPCPTLSRSVPRNARLSVGADVGAKVAVTEIGRASCREGAETSGGPGAAVDAIARATERRVDEARVVEVTGLPAPRAQFAVAGSVSQPPPPLAV